MKRLIYIIPIIAFLLPAVLIALSFKTLDENELLSIMLLFLGSLLLTIETLFLALVIEYAERYP